MQNKVSKDDWVAMFRDSGMDDDAMKNWHRLFETRHPEGHGAFLEWLGISQEEIAKIRAQSK
ncbi:MAG: hypothetical protein GY710_24180 [Desulfobacteraceae bacterium]|nr:hypothetical protein [Desulfobacteraceae bacterium]